MQFCYFTFLSSRNALYEGNINSIKRLYLWFNRKFSKYIGYIWHGGVLLSCVARYRWLIVESKVTARITERSGKTFLSFATCFYMRNHIHKHSYFFTFSSLMLVLNIKLNKKIHILLSQVYCVWQVVKPPTIILNNPV